MGRERNERPRSRRVLTGLAVVLCGTATAACRPPILSVDDTLAVRGEKTQLVAYVEREPVFGLRKDVKGIRVEFLVGDETVGDDRTDHDGRASVKCTLAPTVRRYEARMVADGQILWAEGEVHTWARERISIAVDVDNTIARTDVEELILDPDADDISPLKRSVATLEGLAQDYQILYLTARPRFLRDKTRVWLRDKGFPEGPLVTAKGVRQAVRSEHFKRETLNALRARWPNLRIGIGNTSSDADAYGANDMLALVLEPRAKEEDEVPRHAIVFRDWKTVAEFFAANRATLTDPDQVDDVVDGKRMLLQPVPRWTKP